MADLHLEKTHSFDRATAREQAKKWLEEAKEEFGFDAEYLEGADSDTVTVKKSGVDGRAILTDNKITFEADLNFIAKPFKGMITSGIQAGLDKFFA